jgi:hypothetical protein
MRVARADSQQRALISDIDSGSPQPCACELAGAFISPTYPEHDPTPSTTRPRFEHDPTQVGEHDPTQVGEHDPTQHDPTQVGTIRPRLTILVDPTQVDDPGWTRAASFG